MKSTISLLFLVLLAAGLVELPGCRWGDRHARPEELSRLRGLCALEFDGLFVQLKRDASDDRGLLLVVAGQAVEQAWLRQGEQFLLTDGREVYEAYQVLLADPERITLKRQRTFDHRTTGEGIRTVEDVVAVTPYNLEAIK
jgi:hypothetical protein